MKLLDKLGKVVPETWALLLGKGFIVELGICLDTLMAAQKVGLV